MCPDINFFGNILPNSLDVAIRKFRDCPWPHFDGFPDVYPNRILVSDFAVTLVMNSGIPMQYAWEAVRRADNTDDLLNNIPTDVRLEETVEDDDQVNWNAIDHLFLQLVGEKVRLSRIAKMMCRKRPYLIPMLDTYIWKYLDKIANAWREGSVNPPQWFDESLWESWEYDMPSPYIRMIRHDMIKQVPVLEELRGCLHEDELTEVPRDASLLRIYEATLWRAIEEGLL